MTKHNKLINVYTGSFVEANYIKTILEENGIAALVRNTMRESLVAGWVSGASEDAGLVYVIEIHATEAKRIIEDYLNAKEKPD